VPVDGALMLGIYTFEFLFCSSAARIVWITADCFQVVASFAKGGSSGRDPRLKKPCSITWRLKLEE